MTVSVIIPVYNVEPYLERCLQSVENQTYRDAEVIIVNDGSTDNSYQIIDRYVARNRHFTAYTTENNGLGGARNFGLTKASGEYVVFLDSDDYIAEDCLEKFAAAAQANNSDIVVCNSFDVQEDGTVIDRNENNVRNQTVTLSDAPQILLNRPCAWAKMYRRSLFEGLGYVAREWYEDLRLTPKLYLRAKSITYIEDALFFYVQRAGSIMNNAKVLRNLEILEAFDDLIAYFKAHGAYDPFKAELEFLVIQHCAVAGMTRVAVSNAPERHEVLRKMQAYVSQFEGLYENRYIATMSASKRLILQLNKRRLYWLTALCMKLKNTIG